MYGSEKRDVKGVKYVRLLIGFVRGGTGVKTTCKGKTRQKSEDEREAMEEIPIQMKRKRKARNK